MRVSRTTLLSIRPVPSLLPLHPHSYATTPIRPYTRRNSFTSTFTSTSPCATTSTFVSTNISSHVLSNPFLSHKSSTFTMTQSYTATNGTSVKQAPMNGNGHTPTSTSTLTHDEEQLKLMKEECILVDSNDIAIGHASKLTCHQHDGVSDVPLHRAFSVFLFNSRGELLLQKRSAEKITFPARWTNTCCSHPLYEHVNERDDRIDNVKGEEALGVKHAAIRKLEHELGISPKELQLSDFHYLTKIHYGAHSDDTWGEHEIDWILFVQKDVTCNLNKNEVSDIQYVAEEQLKHMIHEHRQSNNHADTGVDGVQHGVKGNEGQILTPWFSLIATELLFPWWQQLSYVICNDGLEDKDAKSKIHRLGEITKNFTPY